MSRGKRKGPNRAVSPAVELLFNSGQATGGRDCQRHWGSLRNPNPPSVFHFPACCLKHLPFSSTILCSTDFDRKTFPARTVPCSLLQQPEQGDHSIVWNLKVPTIITAYDPKRFWDQCDAWGVYVPIALRVLYRFIGIWDQTKNPLSSLADLDESAVKQSPTW